MNVPRMGDLLWAATEHRVGAAVYEPPKLVTLFVLL